MSGAQLKLADLALVISRVGDDFVLAPPAGSVLASAVFPHMVGALLTVPTDVSVNRRPLERSGDVLADLELEMANDQVSSAVAMHTTMQDLVAMRVLGALRESPEASAAAGESDLVELAYWFNRRYHTLRSLPETEVTHDLSLSCLLWSQQLLDAATA